MTKKEYHVKNIRTINSNSINIINETINNYILEFKRKFTRFKFNCRIDSTIEKFNKNNKINLYITFY